MQDCPYAYVQTHQKIYTHKQIMITYGPQEVCCSACICRVSAIVLYFISIPQYFVVIGTFPMGSGCVAPSLQWTGCEARSL